MSVEARLPEMTTEPTDASPSYFRIFVAAVDNNAQLVYSDQTSENGRFSGTFTQLTDRSYDAENLQASTTMDGFVSVLAQDAKNKHLTYITENRSKSGGGRFADPIDLGLPANVDAFQEVQVINGVNGLANVFGVSSGKTPETWWKFRNPHTVKTETESVIPPGMKDPVEITVEKLAPPSQPWSDWAQIPGAMQTICAANNADGRIILVGLDADQLPHLNFQSADDLTAPETWSGWSSILGIFGPVQEVLMAIGNRSLVHIFARQGGNIYMKVQTEVSQNSFTDWVLFASFETPVHQFAVTSYATGLLYMVAQIGERGDSSNSIYGSHQLHAGSNAWSTPAVITRAPASPKLILQTNADTKLSLFALDSSAQSLRYTDQLVEDFWQASWDTLGGNIFNFAVTQDVTPSTTDSLDKKLKI